ncbi:unnamed protein product [Rangifer tarandus platyrhynchus]|uniref:Uncharacterized protein n=1 Tax=Rangifer tarandus platyrhynchus TaxID=3082113 RepID=A0ABN8ZR32_RANTA|nr:unnamed protein product [Rangifer tarandus platyrhynchus]
MSRINVLTKETPQSSLAHATIHVTAHKQRKSASGKDAADWPYSRICASVPFNSGRQTLSGWKNGPVPRGKASRVAERRLQKGALQKLCPRASCCAACGIRPERRLNARPLRGQARVGEPVGCGSRCAHQGRLEDLVRKRWRGPHLCRCFRTRVQWELWPCSESDRRAPSGAVGVWGRELRPGLGWGRRCCGWRCALHPPPQAETTAPYRLSPATKGRALTRPPVECTGDLAPGGGWSHGGVCSHPPKCQCQAGEPALSMNLMVGADGIGQHDLQEPRFRNQTNCLKTETEAQEVCLSTGILLSHEAAQNDASGRSTDGPRGWILREVSQREKQHKITMAGGT